MTAKCFATARLTAVEALLRRVLACPEPCRAEDEGGHTNFFQSFTIASNLIGQLGQVSGGKGTLGVVQEQERHCD